MERRAGNLGLILLSVSSARKGCSTVRDPGHDGSASTAVTFRQSTAKLLRVLPLAVAMAAASGLLVLVGWRGAGLGAMLAGGLGLVFFGPALLILLWTLVRPNYLTVDDGGLRLRLYSLEANIPWTEIRGVSAGAGWPSLTFHDCERVSGSVEVCGIRPLGWLLEVPTRLVTLILHRPLANVYPTTQRQIVDGFRANEQMFGFHYGLPTSLLEGSTRTMLVAMRRAGGTRVV